MARRTQPRRPWWRRGMPWFLVALTGFFLLDRRTARPDGKLITRIPPFRRMMQYIMPGRNESVVYFDRAVRAEKLEAYLEEARGAFGANMTHAIVAAAFGAFADNPRMNQYVVGRRMYKRDGIWLTFSMKRQKGNREAYLSAVKLPLIDGETFRELVGRINGGIEVERSGKKTDADKEFDILNVLPRPLLRLAVRFVNTLDYFGLLPGWFIKADGMYTSMFIANLGSVGMGPGYHHLYEYGTCPLFLMVGQIEDRVVVEKGKPKVARVLPLRFSFDERISDGLDANYGIQGIAQRLEDPYGWLGCLDEDGADALPIHPHGRQIDRGDTSTYKPPS